MGIVMTAGVVGAVLFLARKRGPSAPTLRDNKGEYLRGSMGTISGEQYPTVALLPKNAIERRKRSNG